MKKLLASLLLSSAFVFAQQPSTKSDSASPAPPASTAPTKIDKAAAYYHFTMAHTY